MGKASPARIRANNKYNSKAYFRPNFCIRKEYEDAIRGRAAEKDMSVSGYIQDLIFKDLGIEKEKSE